MKYLTFYKSQTIVLSLIKQTTTSPVTGSGDHCQWHWPTVNITVTEYGAMKCLLLNNLFALFCMFINILCFAFYDCVCDCVQDILLNMYVIWHPAIYFYNAQKPRQDRTMSRIMAQWNVYLSKNLCLVLTLLHIYRRPLLCSLRLWNKHWLISWLDRTY